MERREHSATRQRRRWLAALTLVAFTVKVPVELPAVYSPVEEIVPPVAVQVTAVFEAFAAVAVNCCVVFLGILVLVGEMLTLTG